MKRLFFALFAMAITAGTLTSCGSGAETKPAADTTAAPAAAPAAADTTKAVDTTQKAASADKPIVVPPNNAK